MLRSNNIRRTILISAALALLLAAFVMLTTQEIFSTDNYVSRVEENDLVRNTYSSVTDSNTWNENSTKTPSYIEYPFEYGTEEALFIVDLRENNPVKLADYIMEGHLFSSHFFDVDARYDVENMLVDWDIKFSSSPSTYSLGLHTLDMVAILSKAYDQTGNIDYLSRARKLVEDWNTYVLKGGQNEYIWYDHSVASRAVNLIYFLSFLEDIQGPPYDADFVSKLVVVLEKHAEWLNNDSNYYPNSNHGIMSDRALIAIALFLGNERETDWKNHGLQRLKRQFDQQFNNDYVHVENSTGYAIGVIDWFLELNHFLTRFNLSLSKDFSEDISEIICRFSLFLKPDLNLPLTGDTFGTSPIHNLPRVSPEACRSQIDFILSQGSVGRAPQETSWLFPEAGYAISRSAWSSADAYAHDTWLLFKSGYIGGTAHKHNDDLSFIFYTHGQDIFTDSGAYNYEKNNPLTNYFTSAMAHNTVIVDGISFDASAIRDYQTGFLEWKSDDDYDYYLATNNLYDGVSIDRHLAFIKPNVLLILDDIVSDNQHSYTQLYNLAPHLVPANSLSNNANEAILVSTVDPDIQVRIRQLIPVTSLKNYFGDSNPLGYGLISKYLGEYIPRHKLEFTADGKDTQFLTVVTIEPRNGQAEELEYDFKNHTLFLGESSYRLPIKIRKRSPQKGASGSVELHRIDFNVSIVPSSEFTWQITARPNNEKEYEYAWYIYKNGMLFDKLWYHRSDSIKYTFPQKGSYRIQLFVRDRDGRVAIENAASLTVYEDILEIEPISGNLFEFSIDSKNQYPTECAWYFYKDEIIYEKVWYTACRDFNYSFEEPGTYYLQVFERELGNSEPDRIYNFNQVPIEVEISD